MKNKFTKNQKSPACPHCGHQKSYKNWHVGVEDTDEYSPVVCLKCDKYFAAVATVTWSTRKCRRRRDEGYEK